MRICQTHEADLPRLMALFAEARGTIAMLGIDQWQDGYPAESVIRQDIEQNRSYLCIGEEGEIIATFVMFDGGDPTYDRIDGGHWMTGDQSHNYTAVHRFAIAVAYRGKGIASDIFDFVSEHVKKEGWKSIRIDTHEGNIVMRKMLQKNGFHYCGIIYLANGDARVAYEKCL